MERTSTLSGELWKVAVWRTRQFLQGKVAAGENESARAVFLLEFEPRQIAQGRQLRANNVKPFFQVQRARFAIQAGPVKIIQPISEIGIFLDFEQHQTRSQSVDDSRGQETRLPPAAAGSFAGSRAKFRP